MAESEAPQSYFDQSSAGIALERMRDIVNKYAAYYEKRTDRAFLIRNSLNATHTVALAALFGLIATEVANGTQMPGSILLVLSSLPIITFSLLQVVYPDRIIEASRRAYRDLSKLAVKLSIASLEEDPAKIVQLLAESSTELSAIFSSSSYLIGNPPPPNELAPMPTSIAEP